MFLLLFWALRLDKKNGTRKITETLYELKLARIRRKEPGWRRHPWNTWVSFRIMSKENDKIVEHTNKRPSCTPTVSCIAVCTTKLWNHVWICCEVTSELGCHSCPVRSLTIDVIQQGLQSPMERNISHHAKWQLGPAFCQIPEVPWWLAEQKTLAECGTDLTWSMTICNGTYNYTHDFYNFSMQTACKTL